MSAFFFLAVLILLISSGSPVSGFQEQEVASKDIDQIIGRMAADRPAVDRAKAIRELNQHAESPLAVDAIDLLKTGLDDANPDVRYESMLTLSLIYRRQGRACPVEILKLADDPYPKIKTNFLLILDFFVDYPPAALPLVLEYYYRLEPEDQVNTLVLLGKAGRKDKRVMLILFDAVNSIDAGRRINGTAALWAATQDFELVLPLYFDRIADFERVAKLPDDDNGGFEGRYPRQTIELSKFGVVLGFHQHMSQRAESFVNALVSIANSPDVEARRRLTGYVTFCLLEARKQLAHAESSGSESELEPQVSVKFDEVPDLELPQCDYRLLAELVEMLSKDADETVRSKAQQSKYHLSVLNSAKK